MGSKLIQYFKKEYRRAGIWILLFSLAAGISRGLILAVINESAESVSNHSVNYYYIIAFLICLVTYLVFSYLSLSRARVLSENIVQKMRIRICEKLMCSNLRILEQYNKGDLYTQLTHDINRLSNSSVTLINILQSVVLLIFCFIYIGYLSLFGVLVAIATLLIGIIIYAFLEKRATISLRLARLQQVEFFEAIQDLLSGFKQIKLNNQRHEKFKRHLSDISHRYKELNIKAYLQFTYSFLTSQVFVFILIALLIFVLPGIEQGQSFIIFQFLTVILFMVGPLETVVTSVPEISSANISLDNVIRLENLLHSTPGKEHLNENKVIGLYDNIELRDIKYTFRDADNNADFTVGPINLTIKKGDNLCIVGGNGSGKTTLLKLLTGLYQPDSGKIFVDGDLIATDDIHMLSQLFTSIFTDFHLFQNLYGIDIKDEKIVNHLLEVLQLNQKTAYVDGNFSKQDLSTGQRKRLAYLVSYLENKSVFIFDEFAADQDPHFRQFFYNVIIPELNGQGKTIIAVSHDDNYFKSFNRIIKMDFGKIVDY